LEEGDSHTIYNMLGDISARTINST
jgi:hypothetical protein